MAKYKIEHDRDNCIGCGACAGSASDFWEMGDDGKSKPKVTEFEEADLGKHQEVAKACPVNVIHIVNTENNEKII